MTYPAPDHYSTWQTWAGALVQILKNRRPEPVLQLPIYTVAKLPKAAQQGQIVFVTDDANGAIPVYSAEGEWRRFSDNSQSTV